ncbi:glycoside hydrolase [Coniochaeta ligniaria NRRL 30616]|uniref:Mannan endo-1,4-beta-mannosidase A n=1 Tax=Coniochaeta ligniaria NRRL 30616 TaxID=1408157 RepID=A0A1J7JVW4_9PEZI|nr:glycoside hydrolase [Coniochaeta ligniaria NRRL 30616]
MKTTSLLTLGLLSLARALPSVKPDTASAASIATANGTRFTIDGQTAYFAGTNSYWIGFLTNNADVDLVLDHISQSGLKILRVWGFNDVKSTPGGSTVWFQQLSASGSTINTGANGLQRLDYVVQSAEKRNVKLIINFVNFWDDYGGMAAYVSAFGGSKEGWFTNSKAQAQYRKYIQAVVSRYVSSAAVFAWELANEPRCKGCNTNVIYNWAADTSAYIKTLDPKHMITLGDEGFGVPGASSYPYGTSEGVDFVKNLKVKDLDFGVFHMYPGSWGVDNSFGPGWIQAHAAACKAANKPCMLEEYGTGSNHCSVEKPWQQASLALATTGMAADLFWQWGDNLSSGRSSDDGNTIYYGSSDATCLITDHVNAAKTAG